MMDKIGKLGKKIVKIVKIWKKKTSKIDWVNYWRWEKEIYFPIVSSKNVNKYIFIRFFQFWSKKILDFFGNFLGKSEIFEKFWKMKKSKGKNYSMRFIKLNYHFGGFGVKFQKKVENIPIFWKNCKKSPKF